MSVAWVQANDVSRKRNVGSKQEMESASKRYRYRACPKILLVNPKILCENICADEV